MTEYFNKIREHYEFLTPIIFEAANKHGAKKWVYPYGEIPWEGLFSPIEKQAWEAIRIFGHVPMYPQYPVKSFFIDFGNPFLKIGIECDGKEFHQDKEKDLARDKILAMDGWIIYRISGSDCFRPSGSEFNFNIEYAIRKREEMLEKFYSQTIDGLIKAIGIFHFGYRTFYRKNPNESSIARKCLLQRRSFHVPKKQNV